MEFDFSGMAELTRQIQKLENGAKGAESEALQEGAKVMQEATEKKAPVRAVNGGTLKANIEISEVENGEIEVYVDNQGKAYYGHMLEVGTSKMRAQPFMGPAFNQSQRRIENAMSSHLKKVLGLS
ncbi:HK97-gp10 family putative phage morphogenesis protein [Alkalibacillus almallahensis]|uniref:HK97-gp10 family putative phage morphogenesis protein n=1 Tax=Alkalibacillus almallahensis TaxID=1379154 RepID=UPI00142469E7|nr:HK97-gp10 family putative phage morphogenesis protein [Alkalibacillus almallahensis]NIK10923.1 HK97 gp10 family phage protein [Alkalibacillus almallahensis]